MKRSGAGATPHAGPAVAPGMAAAPGAGHPAAAPLSLHIAALSLPAMPAARGRRIGAAFEAELSQLLAQPAQAARLRTLAASGGLGSVPALDGGQLQPVAHERPESTGRRLAAAVAQGLLNPSRATGRQRTR